MDLPIRYGDVRDEAQPDPQTGEIMRSKKYTFFLGKFGPFTERIPLDVADQTSELRARVARLREHLEAIHG